MKFTKLIPVLILSLLVGCAGMTRSCSNFSADVGGADWIVVQYDNTMSPKACWILRNTSITNETQSDGIYWLDAESGHLVHISGWYNRVQVKGKNFKDAAFLVGVDLDLIQNGKYPKDINGSVDIEE